MKDWQKFILQAFLSQHWDKFVQECREHSEGSPEDAERIADEIYANLENKD